MEAILEREFAEKLWLCPLPNVFSSIMRFPRREGTGKGSTATRIQKRMSRKANGVIVEREKADIGNEEVKSRTALKNIGNVNSPLGGAAKKPKVFSQILPSDTQAAGNVLGLKPVAWKPIKMVPQKKETINLDPRPGNIPKQISVSDSQPLKLVHSLNSVLSARSKVASGINENSNPQIDEIDLADVDNPQAVVEYVQDLYAFYMQQQHIHRPADYMDQQPNISPKMRAILVDWIIEVHYMYNLLPETLYLAIYIVDRYLSLDGITKRNLQLVGTCAMLIACKYEEIRCPQVDDFVRVAVNRYTREEILGMEKMILNELGWYLTVPTNYMFLVRYVKVAKADQELEHMIYFLAELGLMQYDLLKYCPSMVAASAVYVAHCTLGKSPVWTEALQRHTSFSETQLLECAEVLVKAHCGAAASTSNVVYQKYMLQQFRCVARYPAAMSLLGVLNPDASSVSS